MLLHKATVGVAILGLTVACGSASSDREGFGNTAGPGGAGPTASAGAPDSLTFFDDDTVTVATSEGRTLRVRTEPPGEYLVRFALLGESLDASLDRAEVLTDSLGEAKVVLTAPTRPTAFEVRASSVGAASARLPVSVSELGFATIEVVPQYTGNRPIGLWTASVAAGTTCADLPGVPPPDGPLSNSAFADQFPRIEDVPVGPVLAVTVRADQFAGGCVELENVIPREINQITVAVSDRPMQLAETDLLVELGVDSTDPDWAATLDGTIESVTRAMVGEAVSDTVALLDAMGMSLSDPEAVAFAAQRSAAAWDSLLPIAQTGLRDEAAAWMRVGLTKLEAPDVFEGRLQSSGRVGERATLALASVAGLDPASAGFSVDGNNNFTWTAEPGDTVQLGGPLFWTPSKLFTGLALFGATEAALAMPGSPTVQTVPEALVLHVGCASIGQTLADSGPGAGVAYSSCDADCVEALCTDAVHRLWQRAIDASGVAGQIGTLDITATGQAGVDEEARPLAFDGTWVGRLDVGLGELSVGGPARGSTDPPK